MKLEPLVTGSSEYQALHKRIREKRGLASQHECTSCDKKARDWAFVHGLDPNDIWSYKPMCSGCHRSYDHYHRQKGCGITESSY